MIFAAGDIHGDDAFRITMHERRIRSDAPFFSAENAKKPRRTRLTPFFSFIINNKFPFVMCFVLIGIILTLQKKDSPVYAV